ncbi:RagB/SusD family nutrient uptake outer membrane protein [Parabacteroides sp. OttesenSCG-928-G06]|nr:RagB/SusD family nutrient uptake outer membrane protein [Parabacteroides sp. OttesenSCG-928-G06]
MKTFKYILIVATLLLSMAACDSFLDESPKGVAGSESLKTATEIEKMVIAAYSSLGNDNYQRGMNALWPYGDLRSGDSHKGGDGPGDMGDFNTFETFVYMRDDLGYLDQKWYGQYINIARANDALGRIVEADESEFPKKKIREAEMRFLRAHFYFELKILYKHIPYVDETIPTEEYINVSNVEYSDMQLWDKIVSEFRFAMENLPDNNEDKGRANKGMAQAYLAKALLFSAYEQDEKHNVVNINRTKLEEVVTLCRALDGKYSLAADFAENFLCETENGTESIFAIQHSHSDGTLRGRLDWGAMLNYPMNPEYGCCGFHQPTQNMVNAFRTDEKGLPLLDTFNDKNLSTPDDLLSNNVDPRLNHTVAIPGLPYKYNPEFIFQEDWNRSPQTYGSFMSMKETVLPDCPCFAKADPFMSSSKNRDVIRYADVVLWQAEALIELGRQEEALSLINRIRQRAAGSTSRLVDVQGDPTGKFLVDSYQPGTNSPAWTQDFARKALRFERRLEFSQEGHRFFDLVRWGIADKTVNEYLAVEKTRRGAFLQEAVFTKNRDEYFPIPKAQINFSKKLYQQNYGW